MYKKQLTIIILVYLSFLALFTSCTVLADEAIQEAVEVVPIPTETTKSEATSEEAAAAAESNLEVPILTPQFESKEADQSAALGVESNRLDGSNSADNSASMSGSNSMGGGNMMGQGKLEIPQITDLPEDDIDTLQERESLEILIQHASIARLLANTPSWHVEMWTNDENQTMEIDLYDADWGWIAWGAVALGDNRRPTEIVETYAPNPLTDEEYVAGQKLAQELALADPNVIKALDDPQEWEIYAWYDEWEQIWEVGFYKGLEEFGVRIETYDDQWYVSDIRNLALLDEEQQAADNLSRAINIAWQKEGIDEALFGDEGVEWTTVVTHLGGSEYGVSFVTADRELFFALVDVEAETILE